MNFYPIFRTLLISLLLLLPAAIRAENWQTFELHASAGMAGRSVSVNGSNIGSFSLSQWQWWNGSETVTNGEAVLGDVQIDIDQEGPWIFESGGWQAEVSNETLQGAVGSPGMLQLEFTNAGVPVIELLLPLGYESSYSLAVVQLDDEDAPVLTPVSYSGEVSGTTIQGEAYAWQRAIAPRDPSRSFYIKNLTTSMRSPSDFVHLGANTWTPDGGTPDPLVSVTFYLDPAHYGYSFTLHYQSPGQAEMVQSLTAWPSEVEGNRTMGDGQVVNVTGSMSLTGSVASGSTYWLTLDATNDGIGPAYTHNPQASYPTPLQWSLLTEPLPPEPPGLQTVEFYVPSGMTGGHVHQPSAERELGNVVSSNFVEDYDADGNPHFFYYDVRTAEIDPNEPFWLRINGTELSQGEQWYYDGWSPLNGPSEPPGPQTTVSGTLILPVTRQNNALTLTAPDGSSLGLQPWLSYAGSTQQTVTLNDPWHGPWSLNLGVVEQTFEMTFPGDPANFSGGLTLTDETTGESQGVGNGTTDLSQWWLPPESQTLQISLSRWGHDLRLRQPNGEDYSIDPGASQGDLSMLGGGAWYNPYYYFDGHTIQRPALDFWVYDATTEEEANWNATDLTNWIAVRPPQAVAVQQTAPYRAKVTWEFDESETSTVLLDGAFQIERRRDNVGSWHLLATLPGGQAVDPGGGFALPDAIVASNHSYRFRVAYLYGGRRSGWVISSNSITLPYDALADADGDGLPDWWEDRFGLDSALWNDPDADPDGDGLTNLEESRKGMNPNAGILEGNSTNVALEVFRP